MCVFWHHRGGQLLFSRPTSQVLLGRPDMVRAVQARRYWRDSTFDILFFLWGYTTQVSLGESGEHFQQGIYVSNAGGKSEYIFYLINISTYLCLAGNFDNQPLYKITGGTVDQRIYSRDMCIKSRLGMREYFFLVLDRYGPQHQRLAP